MTHKVIGVLGGMGPAATVDFLSRLVAARAALAEADHLHVLADINPHVPDRNRAATGHGPSPGPTLAAMARGLVAQGAELLCMPCNAAHGWAADIEAAVDVPFVSIIATAGEAARALGRRPALLAVDATLANGLYQAELPGALILPPDRQARLMALIRAVKAGDTGPAIAAGMAELSASLVADGADTIVAACTEVPLVLRQDAISVPLIDTTGALADKVVRLATGG